MLRHNGSSAAVFGLLFIWFTTFVGVELQIIYPFRITQILSDACPDAIENK
jgi:hypothetical protein